MYIQKEKYFQIVKEVQAVDASLVAVSKTKSIEAIKELYDLGQRDFGENYVQELLEKHSELPQDIRWHFIGHLQSNKAKLITPFIYLVHGIDSFKLLKEVNKQGEKAGRTIDVLLQVHIAQEETKFGLDENELDEIFKGGENLLPALNHICIRGMMGMASFSHDETMVRNEFKKLKQLFHKYAGLQLANCKMEILSMGMSGDYKLALAEGSNMIRIGSLLFGER